MTRKSKLQSEFSSEREFLRKKARIASKLKQPNSSPGPFYLHLGDIEDAARRLVKDAIADTLASTTARLRFGEGGWKLMLRIYDPSYIDTEMVQIDGLGVTDLISDAAADDELENAPSLIAALRSEADRIERELASFNARASEFDRRTKPGSSWRVS